MEKLTRVKTRNTREIFKVEWIVVMQWEIRVCSLSKSFSLRIKETGILNGRVGILGSASGNRSRPKEAITDGRGRLRNGYGTIRGSRGGRKVHAGTFRRRSKIQGRD